MPAIEELWIANHTHHDIGFNDYQDVCFRQHGEFVEGALDLIEATADSADPYRWVVEVTGPLLRWLRTADPGQVARLQQWESAGAIEIAGMQYNTTPLLGPEQMIRSLYPVRQLRERYGFTVETAMQDDVNGVAWLFADLLPAIGINFLTLAINQSRGGAPRPFPGGFVWRGPAGGRLPVWNGFHYLFGRSQVRLGDWELVDEKLPPYLRALAEADWFDSRVLYLESTHPMRVDNGPPDARMANFVARWNAEGRTPRMRFVTPRMWRDHALAHLADDWPERRGDWTDWWADGAGSSAYETGINRASHEVVQSAETVAAWLRALGRPDEAREAMERVWESLNLYDEHTWGAFSSIDAPQSLFTRAQWNRKAGFAYAAALNGHDALTRQARTLADALGERTAEGRFNLGDLPDDVAFPASDGELLVLNPLDADRTVLVEVPEYRAGGAPAGMLESAFPRGVPWGGQPDTPRATVRVDVPALGFAFASPTAPLDADDLRADGLTLANEFYTVTVDADTGAIASWRENETGREWAASLPEGGFGTLVRETIDDPSGRDALYLQDFASWDFGYWREQADVPFVREAATAVTVEPAVVKHGFATLRVRAETPGLRRSECMITLPSRRRELWVDWLIDKEPCTDPESYYVLFGSTAEPRYRCDLNGVPASPFAAAHGGDQLDGSVEYFTPVRRWARAGEMVLCPLDAPLVQFGGITTNRFTRDSAAPSGLVSWALNNHWMVNFRAEQSGEIPLRYRLSTPPDEAAAIAWAADVSVPPVVLRDYRPRGERSGRLAPLISGGADDGTVETTLAPAADGGILLRRRNLTAAPVNVDVPAGAVEVTPIEAPCPGASASATLGPFAWRTWRLPAR